MPPFDIPATALIEREAVTILCSEKDWIRTAKGHNIVAADQRYKEGDGPRFAVPAETTDRLVIFGSNGRFCSTTQPREAKDLVFRATPAMPQCEPPH